MTETKYFILCESDDGMQVNAYSEDEMQELLSWNNYEHRTEMDIENGCKKFVDVDEVDFVNNYEEGTCVIIKGEVIFPKEKKTVVEYEL